MVKQTSITRSGACAGVAWARGVVAWADGIGNAQAMTGIPPSTRCHRWLGWHAPALRRTVIVGASALIVAAALLWFVPWGVAMVTGWDRAKHSITRVPGPGFVPS